MPYDKVSRIVAARVNDPGAIAAAAARRAGAASLLGEHGKAMIIAADHPARGANGVGGDPNAMADRFELLDRLCVALERPGVTGVLATADILEDLLLLGVLDGKSVFGSMNRAGLAGSVFEIDDRFTAYDSGAIRDSGLDGGKMLLRIDPADPATAPTMQACAQAVSALAGHGLMAMVEPFISHRENGRLRNDLSADAMTRAITVASGLGSTSAYTWLKVPVVEDMERVMSASSLPALLLGGEVPADPDAAFESWQKALTLPTVKGIVAGRSLLYPHDDDVAVAVDTAVSLL